MTDMMVAPALEGQEAVNVLIDAGIMNEDGTLTEMYATQKEDDPTYGVLQDRYNVLLKAAMNEPCATPQLVLAIRWCTNTTFVPKG